ncbi:flagellar basal body P-ring formation chaperone FlgA [Pseudomonas typographi]|uniref:Flagella basal body P-ring formation protein FlgA n=1 Tax=Pseudomonas typographi TaxID=2715964 RepID=A0ABR7YZN0_9PSED|nr:flagellar basal body P-ring formation chaperone FlgA [Pseudomonas typographi]MBD1550649.1 flagellar basal body P-ring formation protein FlgA [Pseudomonas typographi]MBD1586766.1 flagellar basal body P-ring formation protein FlgA [Pseudomonas typographi]MBD1598660.1 flagellar basal body P-ring formation protein FlgA [Pseudomonas typographi]
MNVKTPFSRHLLHALSGLVTALCLFGSGRLPADEATLPEQLIGATQGFLEFTVEDYLATAQIEGRPQVEVNDLDPRLSLPGCEQPLAASLQSPATPVGRVVVKVRCEGPTPWTVFVPAQVHLFRQVVTATRPMKRNDVIGQGDVALRERDVGPLSQGYLTELDQALGLKLTRPAVMDQVLSPVQVERPEVIRKGDQVVISAGNAGIAVRMPGEALADGGEGEQIRVRNLRSNRVVKARVTGPGQVEVAM